MYRENNDVGLLRTPNDEYSTTLYKRTKRSRKDIKDDIFSKTWHIRVLKQELKTENSHTDLDLDDMKKQLAKEYHALSKLINELDQKDHGNIQHKRLKSRGKKWNLNKLEDAVIAMITKLKANGDNDVTKEDMAFWLNARVSQVEHVFMRLNQKGILSQPIHHAMHDSQRDPWGYLGSSDWVSDRYYIL